MLTLTFAVFELQQPKPVSVVHGVGKLRKTVAENDYACSRVYGVVKGNMPVAEDKKIDVRMLGMVFACKDDEALFFGVGDGGM